MLGKNVFENLVFGKIFILQAHCRPGGPTAAGVTKTTSRSSVSSSIGGLSSPTEDPQRSFVDPALPTEHGYTHTSQAGQAPPPPRRDSQGMP